MRISISVGGRFHAFDLAGQLQRRGHLQRLITSYPKFKALQWGIPRDKTRSVLSHELLVRGLQRESVRRFWDAQYWLHQRYDRIAAALVPRDVDLFVGWASQSLYSLRGARERGAAVIVERGSSHIGYQRDILLEERERCGLPPIDVTHPGIVERELEEYEEADFISVPSSFVRRTFLARGVPENKLIQIPYGVDLSSFRPIPKGDKVFRIIHCGGITLQKGVHYLLRAFHGLRIKNAELWLIGRVSDEIKPFLRQYRNPKIRLMGSIPQSELHKVYSQGSVFCLASIQEGMAMVILQAMACGLPVICTENTGGEDIVRGGIDGYVVPIRDPVSLQEKILLLGENEEMRRAMAESARQRVLSGYSWDDYGERVTAAYACAIEKVKGGGSARRA